MLGEADTSALTKYEIGRAIKDAQCVMLEVGDIDHDAFHEVKISKKDARRLRDTREKVA